MNKRGFIGVFIAIFAVGFSVSFLSALSSASAASPTVLASSLNNLYALAADNSDLYFSEYTGALKKVSKEGGAVATLADNLVLYDAGQYRGVNKIVLDDSSVYAGYGGYNNYAIVKVSKSGGPKTLLSSTTGGYLLGIIGSDAYELFYGSGFYHIVKLSLVNGSQTIVLSGDFIRSAAMDGRYIYFIDYYSKNLYKFDTVSNSLVLLIDESAEGAVFLDDSNVYWSAPAIIKKISKLGGAAAIVASGSNLRGYASDNAYVYFTENGDLKRISVSGGQAEIILSAIGEPAALTVDGSHLYWLDAANGKVMKMLKDPNQPPTLSVLSQRKSDSITPIQENGITQESMVVFKATLNDPDSDRVKLQMELRQFNEPFTGTDDEGISTSDLVNSGSEAVISRQSLVAGSYHWRARAVDSRGGVSDWREFGIAGNIDFTVGRTIKVAVILAEPSDKSFDPSHNKTYFETQIIPDVKDYYCEVSFGKRDQSGVCRDGLVNLEFDAFDNNGVPYKLDKNQQYYGENFATQEYIIGTDGNGQAIKITDSDRTEQFAWDAINAADGGINYNDYESVMVVYYGNSEQDISFQEYKFWTQTLSVSFAPANAASESAKNWITVAEGELRYPWFHEIGHAVSAILIGSPLCDLYENANPCPLGYGGSVSNRWDVMGKRSLGEILFDFVSHLSSFGKVKLRWLKEENVNFGIHTIESLETARFGDPVKRYNLLDGSYYLLESRTNNTQYSKWDVNVPKDALVIYKISPKQLTVNNQPQTIEFVNIAKDIGLVADLPYRDPINKVLIGLINWAADSNSFKIDAEISELNLQNYIGTVLKPKLFLLEKVWQFATSPLRAAHANIYMPDVKESVLSAKIQSVDEFIKQSFADFIKNGVNIIIILLLLIFLAFSVFAKVAKSENRFVYQFKNYKKVIFLTLVFLTILFFTRFLNTFGFYSGDILRTLNPFRVSVNTASSLDLDLHAITSDGKHTGMNYQTREYENQIPGAITSGDLTYDDEWIFVPENTQVKYYTSSRDIQEFLNQNPDIAQQLPSTQETYALSAMYYDSQGQKYESTPLTNQSINPGENIVYQTTGTTDIQVTQGITDNQTPIISHTQLLSEYLLNSSPITFSFSADDGEGVGVKEISATLDNQPLISGQTINFNQIGEHTIQIVAEDFVGNISTQTIVFKVVYQFGGFLPPIKTDGSGIYKFGRTLPIKFQLSDANNQYIPTANVQLFVAKMSDGVVGTDEVPLSTGSADSGNQFRYDQTENQYIYNLSSDNLSVGSWQLKVMLDDGKYYAVVVSIR